MFVAIAAAALATSASGIAKEDLWMIEASGDTRRIQTTELAPAPRKPLLRLIPKAKPGSELAAIIARVKRENRIKG